ncbi:MAG TPA: NnrU family protein, partial [Kiloniellaceae bacterium]|nr:NnrU family protein [Kiloniellaceae bacterium]
MMTESYNELIAATLVFVGGHLLLCSRPLRQGLVARFGAQGARAITATALFASFVWMIVAYGRAPEWLLWDPPQAFAWVPLATMPFASILLVSAFTTPSPTGVAGAAVVNDAPRLPICGILTVTRHPMLWGTALWAVGHLFVGGQLATIILCLGILLLSLVGMWHIDQRREAELGSAWGPVKMTSSV